MILNRRTFVGSTAAALLLASKGHTMEEVDPAQVYAIIGQMMSAPGKRDELIGYLTEGSAAMPGNLSYEIWRDKADENAIWITEVWTDEASHKASLGLPQVQEAIRKARPIIAGFGARAEVERAGGKR
ncbi:putative quinol monooxygenase [Novosphingobium sp. MMS21-SN21R]|uniref:putative quinol monooxygenase n=1 Tax=Novosphingobium sp. MMS21-SN21R TaxID=2969298 RepID=UPI0028865F36|nr:putative quinol monooxygenase [Novosphingobium sp. MMS21-SN21R]MDT0508278.1 putative quinol monooxygenase [Novosphingobium sp. MMS21-SN21R]